MKTRLKIFTLSGLTLLMAACQTEQTPTPVSIFANDRLTPFATHTQTPAATATSQDAPTATLAPTFTSTPVTYTVKNDETMFVIAYRYGITTAEIKAANPDVDPYTLTAGTVLIIPVHAEGVEAPTSSAPTSTPYPLNISTPYCKASLSGGYYCFAEIKNEQEFDLANISAEFTLTNPQTGEVQTQKALLPLSRITAGTTLPLFAYFANNNAANPQVSVQLQTALNATSQNIPVTISNSEINIAQNGQYAAINAQAVYDNADTESAKIWVAAVAYNAENQIVGVRRFESPTEVKSGEIVTVSLYLYGVEDSISRVELFGEALP